MYVKISLEFKYSSQTHRYFGDKYAAYSKQHIVYKYWNHIAPHKYTEYVPIKNKHLSKRESEQSTAIIKVILNN